MEDVPNVQVQIADHLTQQLSGYAVVTASSRLEALQRIVDEQPDLILLDLVIPSDSHARTGSWTEGRDVLRQVKARDPHVKVIVLTSRGDKARDFLKEEGADDFFTKDAWEDWTRGKLALAIEDCIGYLVCRSPAMQQTRKQLEAATEEERFVLLQGEHGTGKRYAAQVIHRCSQRAHLRLEELDCSLLNGEALLAVLLGRLGSRDTGTVLLHRVEALPAESQRQLATLLEGVHRTGKLRLPDREEREITARLVLTVTGDWRELHTSGKVTSELYSLFAPDWGPIGKGISLPPLRERREDIPDLITHFCHRFSRLHRRTVTQIHPHALAVLERMEFPGNVRQLERIVEAAVQSADGDTLLAKHLPVEPPGRYRVIYSRGAGREEREISFKELAEFTDPAEFDLIVRCKAVSGSWKVESIVVHGRLRCPPAEVGFDDGRERQRPVDFGGCQRRRR